MVFLKRKQIDLSPLKNCHELIVIWLSGNELTTIDLTPLESCKNIEEISLTNNPIVEVHGSTEKARM